MLPAAVASSNVVSDNGTVFIIDFMETKYITVHVTAADVAIDNEIQLTNTCTINKHHVMHSWMYIAIATNLCQASLGHEIQLCLVLTDVTIDNVYWHYFSCFTHFLPSYIAML